jgi:CRP-like cAMP-binding protein
MSNKDYDLILEGLSLHIKIVHPEEHLALKSLARRFTIRTYKVGDKLWELDTTSGQLFFILSGAFAEYLMEGMDPHLFRFYLKNGFAYSEDLILYSTRPATYAHCLTDARVATIPAGILADYLMNEALGGKLLMSLIELSMTEYRNTTYKMLQTSGIHRINAAIEQFPDVLDLIPRKELADYLGISRASLFRSLKQIEHG